MGCSIFGAGQGAAVRATFQLPPWRRPAIVKLSPRGLQATASINWAAGAAPALPEPDA